MVKLKGCLHILKTLLHTSRLPSGEVLSVSILSSLYEDCPFPPTLAQGFISHDFDFFLCIYILLSFSMYLKQAEFFFVVLAHHIG